MAFRRMSLNQVAFVGVVVMVLLGAFLLIRSTGQSEIQLPVLAILGVVGLLAVLTFMALVFSNLGLSDPREALGLPSGSIRAVIALSLIVIFVISAIFLFAVLSFPYQNSVTNVSAAQADSIPVTQLISRTLSANSTDHYDVIFTVPPGAAEIDFAKQLLTILGALVTAITSFYFGTQAAQGPRPKPSPPTLSSLDPASAPGVSANAPSNTVLLTVQGDNLLEVTQLLLMQGTQAISGTGVTSNMSTASATFEIDSSLLGDYDVVAKTREGDTVRLAKAFKVEAPPPVIPG